MNFMKRAILSMKKDRNIINFDGSFLIVTNLVLSGYTIQNASKSSGCCKKKLGADVTLGLDFDKIGQKLRKLEKCQIRRSSMQKKQIN